jgi:predicted nucleic acid-binding protein
MEEAFADAFYWIALANPTDQWHKAAKRFNSEEPETLLLTTEEVLVEFLNYYAKSGERRRQSVGSMCEQVLIHPNITVIPQTHESFLEGFDLYRKRADKGYSLTDCISMSIMAKRGIENVLTHDVHFQQEGFTILF